MSKAFVREDDVGDDALPPRNFPVVPPGAKNYQTARGNDRLRQELTELGKKRSGLSATARDPEVRQTLQALDQRIRHLLQSLRTAEVVPPSSDPADVVRFGATVAVRDDRGVETRYRIVGVDETDFEHGEVSWLSPLAQAMLNARIGQRVRFKAPRGEMALEIVGIAFD